MKKKKLYAEIAELTTQLSVVRQDNTDLFEHLERVTDAARPRFGSLEAVRDALRPWNGGDWSSAYAEEL